MKGVALMKRVKAFFVLFVFLVSWAYPTPARAINLRDIIKDGALIIGGGAVVRVIAGPINDFINTITMNRGAQFQGYTKVVPIVSIGDGTHIGAAQVGGTSKESVDQTQAVAQLETSFQGIRIRVLIPIDSLNPIQQFRRVQGVGVTAIIDVRI